nr:MMPL family transporter [Helcococcus sueciensis]
MGQYQEGTKESIDEEFIQETFGQNIQVVVLVPRGNLVKENNLINELKKSPYITYVQSYTEQVGKELPTEVTPSYAISSLLSENYSRIVLNTNTKAEGEITFEFVKYLKETVSKYYTDYEILGESVSMEEMSRIIQKDNRIVNILAIVSIALVILFNFKSLLLPLILVFTIEASIWINLSIPYFTNTNLSFIGYLVISSIQLGATVDYAILYTNNYLEFRKKMGKKKALIETGAKVYGSLMAPALILTVAGILLSIISSITLVSELGTVLGRGAFLSFLLVVVLLPALLYIFDNLIEKTMYKPDFKKE